MFGFVVANATTRSPKPSQTKKSQNFISFKQRYNKTYNAKDEKREEENYKQNQANNEAHNKRSNETYKRGENSMSNMSFEEKKSKRMGLKLSNHSSHQGALLPENILKNVSAPVSGESDCFDCDRYNEN